MHAVAEGEQRSKITWKEVTLTLCTPLQKVMRNHITSVVLIKMRWQMCYFTVLGNSI